jgi:hypothetical protein
MRCVVADDNVRALYERLREGASLSKRIKRNGGSLPPSPGDGPISDCPLVPLGHADGVFHFLDVTGQKRHLGARQLALRADLLGLFLGDSEWLLRHFPKRATQVTSAEGGGEVQQEIVIGIHAAAAADWLMARCREAGLFGDHLQIRRPGIWVGEDGRPILHCGDAVIIDGETHRAGVRRDGQIWAAGAPTPRPAEVPAVRTVAHDLRERIGALWNFRDGGGEVIFLGLIAVGYLGAAASWRPHGFVLGPAESGKSQMQRLAHALWPLSFYTTDTTKAALEQALNGRAMPSVIDEAGETTERSGAQHLLRIVLGASGGDGTRGHRGTAEGQVRTIQVAGVILMAAITPPDMQAQHIGRFCLIELTKAAERADNSAQHRDLISEAKKLGPGLWARMLAGFGRWQQSLPIFRQALQHRGCSPRQMDQFSAILAGWWVLAEDHVPNAAEALYHVNWIAPFIAPAEELAQDDAHRRLLQHLLGSSIALSRSTERATIGSLLDQAFKPDAEPGSRDAFAVLKRHGIRVMREEEPLDSRGRPPPRGACWPGVWFARGAQPIAELLAGTPWEGQRWEYALRRCESATQSRTTIRFDGKWTARAIWVSLFDLEASSDAE